MASGIAPQNIGVVADHLLPLFLERLMGKKIETDFTFQEYPMTDWGFRKHALKSSVNGKEVQWRIQRGTQGDAIKVRPYQPVPRNYQNRTKYGSATWGMIAADASWNELVDEMFTPDEALTQYMDDQFLEAIKSDLDRKEKSWWEVPESSSDDLPFYGVPYWLPMLGSGTEDPLGGFNGQTAVLGDASTTTTIGRTDRSTETSARTWAATHNGVNSAYLKTLRASQEYTSFKAPQGISQYADTSAPDFRHCTSMRDAQDYEELVNRGPDMRNGDANPFYGMLTYRGQPWMKVPALNDKAYSPGYGVNFTKLFPIVFKKRWMKWTEAVREPNGDVHSFFKLLESKFQFVCTNERQAGYVMHTVR